MPRTRCLAMITGGGGTLLIGIWLFGAGINYVPLAYEAPSLSKPGALEDELRGAQLRRELRKAGWQQLWIAVPLAVAPPPCTESGCVRDNVGRLAPPDSAHRVAPRSHGHARHGKTRLLATPANPRQYAQTRTGRPPPHVHGRGVHGSSAREGLKYLQIRYFRCLFCSVEHLPRREGVGVSGAEGLATEACNRADSERRRRARARVGTGLGERFGWPRCRVRQPCCSPRPRTRASRGLFERITATRQVPTEALDSVGAGWRQTSTLTRSTCTTAV
jgi:hypothetical protein